MMGMHDRVQAQNFIFAQLNGSPMNTTGWTLQGDARVTDITGTGNSELMVCSIFGSSGAAFYNQPINLSQCNKWIAEFDFRMFDGTGADGLTFCFLDVPPTGFVFGGGMGIPDAANGLKVCFDTWNNCIPFDANTVHQDMPKIEIRWGTGYNVNHPDGTFTVGECIGEPTRDNHSGDLSFIRSPDYNHAKITYDSGNIQVFVNNTLYLAGYQQFNFTGYLGFTASTGGYTDDHSIKNVVIYTEMPPSFAGSDQSFCPYDTIRIGGPANPSYNYSWSPSTGLSDPSASNPLLHIPGDAHDDQYINYFVKTSFKNKSGCASTDSVTVRVIPNPKINFLTPEICLTDAIAQFNDSTYTNDNSTLPFSYQWNFGDPNAGPGNPNGSTLVNPTHHYSAASNYLLTLAVTNNEGCRDTLSKIFTVNGAIPLAAFSLENPTVLCSNQLVTIQNESSVDFGSITRLQVNWGDSAGVIYTDELPYPGKTYSHLYANPVSTAVVQYKIQMISSSGITCQNESDHLITLQPAPHVLFNMVPSFCDYDSSTMITQVQELSGLPGSYSFTGEGISMEGLFSPHQTGAGNFSILYKYTATNGCSDSAFQNLVVVAPPKVTVGNDTSIVVNQPLQLDARSTDITEDIYIWSPVNGLDNPSIANPVALLGPGTDTIRYSVKATDTAGCYGTASIKVRVFKTAPDIFVPNAFTPGNTMDNIFRPIPVGISSIQYFRIYNRWGQLIFSTSRAGDGWDGNISGKPQQTGSYVWMVQGTTYTGTTISKKGTMTLIR
jgi:gliding motility-associated-like protein